MTNNPDKRIFGEAHYIDDNDAFWIIDSILKEKTILTLIKFFNLRADARRKSGASIF